LSPAPRRLRRFGIIVLTPIAALVAIGAIRAYHTERSMPAMVVQPYLPSPRLTPSSTPAASDVATADALLADVYPSKQSAVRALTRRLPDAISAIVEKPARFRLGGAADSTPGAMVRDALRAHFPAAAVEAEPQAGEKAAAADEVVIDVRVEDLPAKFARSAAKGSVQISLAGASRSAVLSTKFTQCDWADDLTTYINEHPGHNWFVVRSSRPGLSPAEAKRSAEQNAADILGRLVAEQAPRRAAPELAGPRAVAPVPYIDTHQLPITERFVQRFRRPYGDVWAEAILLDASPQWVDATVRREIAIASMGEMRVQSVVGSTAIVLVAILGAYAFANVVTKRYFTDRLRAIAIAAALAAVGVAVGIITVA
jgi:hypothetical protein